MQISTISFDLTGTLLRPVPSLGDLCVEAMRAQQIPNVPAAEVFNNRRVEARRVAQANGHSPTSETRSRQYWRSMLWEIFAGRCSNKEFEIATEFIYQRLAEPAHWALLPGVVPALSALRFLGLKLVVLSNGDARWEKALVDKKLAPFFDDFFVSASTGFAKPDIAAFDNVCQKTGIARGELLHVGDTLVEDIVPAHTFGAHAVWVTQRPDGLPPEGVPIFDSLSEVPEYVRAMLVAENKTRHFSLSARNLLANLRNLPEEKFIDRDFDGGGNKSGKAKNIAARSLERLDRAAQNVPAAAPLFDKVLQSKGLYEHSLQSRILDAWSELVPAKFAARTAPLKLEKHMTVLFVVCESATIRQEMNFIKTSILKKIQALSGAKKIKSINFILS